MKKGAILIACAFVVLGLLLLSKMAISSDDVVVDGLGFFWEYVNPENECNEDIKLYYADLDGDGKSDVILRDGDQIIAIKGPSGEELWRCSGVNLLITGDMNGDGGSDVIVYEGELGTESVWGIQAIDGSNGEFIWNEESSYEDWAMFEGVEDVIPAGDINGDGKADIVVIGKAESDPYNPSLTTCIYAVNGLNGSTIWKIDPLSTDVQVSVTAVLPTDDLNNDGKDDLIIALKASSTELQLHDEVHLIIINSDNPDVPLGEETIEGDLLSLQSGGDLDGDGITDVLLKTKTSFFTDSDTEVQIWAIPLDGLFSFLWERHSEHDLTAIPTGDLDGDGKDDIVLIESCNQDNIEKFDIFTVMGIRGYDGSDLWRKGFFDIYPYAVTNSPPLDVSVFPAGDLDGDGKDDVLINAWLGLRNWGGWFSISGRGAVLAVKGYNGSELWREIDSDPEDYICAFPAGDMDGDGKDDVLLHHICAYSLAKYNTEQLIQKRGVDGKEVASVWLGGSNYITDILTQCDLNGDDTSDVTIAYCANGFFGEPEGTHICALTYNKQVFIFPGVIYNNGPTNVSIYTANIGDWTSISFSNGKESIPGEDIEIGSDGSTITAKFDFTDKEPGLWDLVITLQDGTQYRIPSDLELKNFVKDIIPEYGFQNTTQLVTLHGAGFTDGTTVKLTKDGETDINGQDIQIVDETTLTAKLDLTDTATGLWDLVVTLPSGIESRKKDAFEVVEASGQPFLRQTIDVGYNAQEVGIDVPEGTHNLFVTLQKTTLVTYGNSWEGSMSLIRKGEKIATTSGSHDFILQLIDPEPGAYVIAITGHEGRGILTVRTQLPELPLGEWAVGSIYCSYGSVWYQVDVPSNQDSLYLNGKGMGLWSHFIVYYGRYGASDHWQSPDASDDRQTSIEIPNPKSGTYIVEFMDSAMIWDGNLWMKDQSRDVLIKAGTTFSIAQASSYLPKISSVSPNKCGNAGIVTIKIEGTSLNPEATVSLVRQGLEDIIAENVSGTSDGTNISATFNLTGVDPGNYDLVVTNPDGRNVTAPNPILVTEGGKPKLWAQIIGRDKIRVGKEQEFIIRFGNSGDVDIIFPIFEVAATPDLLLKRTQEDSKYTTGSLVVPGIASSPTPGILPPHSSYSLPIYVKAQEEGSGKLTLSSYPIVENQASQANAAKANAFADTSNEVTGHELMDSITTPLPKPPDINKDLLPINYPSSCDSGCKEKFDQLFMEEFNLVQQSAADKRFYDALSQQQEHLLKWVNWLGREAKGAVSETTIETVLGLAITNVPAAVAYSVTTGVTSAAELVTVKDSLQEVHSQLEWFYFSRKKYEHIDGEIKSKIGDVYDEVQSFNALYKNDGQKENQDEKDVQFVNSSTPEDKYGPTGFDLPDTAINDHAVPPDQNFYYKVDFWNKETASAPACDVFVKDQLDTDFDWNTFRFEEIGFLKWTVKLEPCQYFNVNVDMRPDEDLIVNVEGTFDPKTGEIYWTFRSLDPDTMDTSEDPMAGFLPPITESGNEIGWVCFSVDPEAGLPDGTEISNQAFVKFDVGDFHPAPKEGPFVNTIISFLPGDANGDGSINVQDVVCIINVILDTGTAPGSLDCNGDGNVNVLDVICVINKILGG